MTLFDQIHSKAKAVGGYITLTLRTSIGKVISLTAPMQIILMISLLFIGLLVIKHATSSTLLGSSIQTTPAENLSGLNCLVWLPNDWAYGLVVNLVIGFTVVHNIIQRQQTEKALHQNEVTYRALLNAIPDLMIRMTQDGTYLDFITAKNLKGVTLEANRQGQHIFEVMPPELAYQRMHYVEKALATGEAQIYEYQLTLADGSVSDQEARIVVSGEKEVLVMVRDISDRKRAEALIQYQAFHDLLTGLPNRLLFNQQLWRSLTLESSHRKMMAVMFLDLDRFKTINDTLGHTIGDRLLQNFAERVKNCLREDDSVSRWGGDEFTVLLPQINYVEDAAKIAQRILDALKHPFHLDMHTLYVTSSIGIALYPQDGEDAETLLCHADAALYLAKAQGRNNYRFYIPALNLQVATLLSLENQLYQALEREEFVVYYQPEINITTGEITSLEALVRWQHPEFGLLLPEKFIPIAEENGLIVPISEWVLQTACAQSKAWQEAGFSPPRIAVNLSPQQFHQPNMLSTVKQVLLDNKLSPQFLELEITETTILQNVDVICTILPELQAMGVHIAIDDFGRGYSALTCLKEFTFDRLKIDQLLILDLTENPLNKTMISAILTLGKSLNLKIVAEGVETVEQLELLQSLNCEEMQGNLFCQPLTVAEAKKLLENRCMRTTVPRAEPPVCVLFDSYSPPE